MEPERLCVRKWRGKIPSVPEHKNASLLASLATAAASWAGPARASPRLARAVLFCRAR